MTFDGGFIIAGKTVSFGAGNGVYLIKTDAQGNEQWSRTYGEALSVDEGWWVQQTSDSGYIITGGTRIGTSPDYNLYLVRTDAQGNEQWSRVFGGNELENGRSVQQTDDGGFLIVGYTTSYGGGESDVYLIKTDNYGNTSWTKTIGGIGHDSGQGLEKTSDGGFAIAGLTSSYGAGGYDVYLIRLASLKLTLSSRTNPVQILSGGGSFNFEAEIINYTYNPITFDAWTEVVLPDGNTYGPLLMRENLSIQGRQTIMRARIVQNVPGYAPPGNYRYVGKVRINPDSVISSDSFHLVKLPGENSPGHNQDWDVYGWFDEGESQFSILKDNGRRVRGLCDTFSASPNPFNQRSLVSFSLKREGLIRLAVYDVSGREVAALAEGWYPAGHHSMLFDASGMASGVYFARLEAGDFSQARKLLLVK